MISYTHWRQDPYYMREIRKKQSTKPLFVLPETIPGSAKDKILKLLQDGKWHTSQEIIKVGGAGGTRRIRELRKKVTIELRGSGNKFEYRLKKEN